MNIVLILVTASAIALGLFLAWYTWLRREIAGALPLVGFTLLQQFSI
jgi:hypothetical protein